MPVWPLLSFRKQSSTIKDTVSQGMLVGMCFDYETDTHLSQFSVRHLDLSPSLVFQNMLWIFDNKIYSYTSKADLFSVPISFSPKNAAQGDIIYIPTPPEKNLADAF